MSSSLVVCWAIFLIFFGCCVNVLTLEVLTKRDPGSGNLITAAQFVFISLTNLGVLRSKLSIPIWRCIVLTAMFWMVSLLNNMAFGFRISIPVHTVFRSASLSATLLVGQLIFRRAYSRRQQLACIIVNAGILALTLADSKAQRQSACGDSGCTPAESHTWGSLLSSLLDFSSVDLSWFTGISMLSVSLAIAAYMGHYQDDTLRQYGKDGWRSLVFFTHALGLPAFALFGDDILEHAKSLPHIPPLEMPIPFTGSSFSFSMPLMLLANILMQNVCIQGVYMLTAKTSALTNTLVITGRKCISLLLSVYLFQNPFTAQHWAGTALVFIGVFIYSTDNSKRVESASASASGQSQQHNSKAKTDKLSSEAEIVNQQKEATPGPVRRSTRSRAKAEK